MGITRRKASDPTDQPTTEQRLADARAELARIDGRLAAADQDRDLALIDDDRSAIEQTEANIAELKKERERAAKRIDLLTAKAEVEIRERQREAHEGAIARQEAVFEERDQSIAEMCSHLEQATDAFRRAIAANAAAHAGWQFDATDAQACLFGRWLVAGISNELYRLTGSPFVAAGVQGEFEFPGARCPSITDPNPGLIAPLVDKAREATAYAVRKMRAAPIRPLPIAVPEPVAAPKSAPEPQQASAAAAAPENSQASAASPEPPAEKPCELEFAFFVGMSNTQTGEEKTFEVLLTPEDVEAAGTDGIGPFGPLGRQAAIRRAREAAGSEYVLKPNAVTANVGRLQKSMNAD
jgi:hypothetical protein